MSITIAIVVNVTGQAWAEAPDGSRRLLESGDALMLGERLITADDARITLDFGYNNEATVDGGISILASTELANNFTPSTNDSSLEEDSVAQALAAIENALGTSLEGAEAPAAGIEGGSAGGSSAVRLARIVENINDADFSLNSQPLQRDTQIENTDRSSTEINSEAAPLPGSVSIDSISQGTGNVPPTVINGTSSNLAANNAVTITITDQDGNTVSQTVTAGPDGAFTSVVSATSQLVDGPITVQVSAEGANGEVVTDSRSSTLDLVSGELNVANLIVNDDAQTLSLDGTSTDVAPEGQVTVTITDSENNTVTSTAIVNSDGSYALDNVDISNLVDGELTIVASTQDRNGNTVTDSASGAVNAVDDVPVIAGDLTGNVTEDDATILTASGTLTANGGDPGEDGFTPETLTGTYGELVIGENGTWTYNANNDQAAIQGLSDDETLTDSFTVTNADGVTTGTITITINGSGDAPLANDDAALTTNEDTVLSNIDVLGNDTDADGDALTVTAASATNGIVTINNDGTLNYTPNANFNGSDTISYTVSDGNGGTDSATLAITVDPVNDQSSLSLTDGSAIEDTTEAGAVIAEITLTDEEGNATVDFTAGTNDNGYYEIVGNEVRLTAAGEAYLDAGNALPGVSLTTDDGVTVTNTVTTTPVDDTSTLSLTDGSAVEDSTLAGDVISTFTVTDEEGGVTVDFAEGTNDNGYYAIDGNTVVLTDAGEAFLDDGNTLPNVSLTTSDGVTVANTVTTTTVDDQSTLSLTDGSAVEDTTVAGDVISTFTVTDEEGGVTVGFAEGTNTEGYYDIVDNNVVLTAAGEAYLDAGITLPNVSLTTNDGVTATNTVTTTTVNDQSTLSLTDGSAVEDTTVAGDVISEVTFSDEEGNASFDFTPGPNDNGYYEIVGNEIRLTDAGEAFLDAGNELPNVSLSTSDGVTATNTMTTATVNDAPELGNNNLAIDEGATVILNGDNLSATDPDNDDPSLTFTVSNVTNGQFQLVADGSEVTSFTQQDIADGNIQFVHDGSETAPSYEVAVSDGALTDSGSAAITFTPVNDAPVANDDATLTIDEDTVLSNINVLSNDTDSDGDALTVIEATATNGTVAINADGTLNYTPNANFAGDDIITYTVSDGNGGTDSASIVITVNPVADAATITVHTNDAAVTEDDATDNTGSGTVTVSDADAGEGSLVSSAANFGAVAVDGDGNWTYTLDNTNTTVQALKAGETLTDTLTFTSDDGTTTTQDITINGTDDVPTIGGDTTGAVTEDFDVDAGVLTTSGTLTASGGDAGEDTFSAETLAGTYGELTIGENGTWTYSADNSQQAIQDLAVGQSLTDTFTITNADGVTTQEVTITLNGSNEDPIATDDTFVSGTIPGLSGEYYAYSNSSNGDGVNLTNVDQVETFIAANQADATFTGTSIDYGSVSGNLGNEGKLQTFLKNDADSLSNDPENSSDAIIRMTGNLDLEPGTYQLRVRADDGYRIEVNGQTVAEYNGNQSANTRTGSEFTLAGEGPHSVEIVYWDQGGKAQLRVELREQGGQFEVLGSQHLSHLGDNPALVVDENQPLEITPATLLENDVDTNGDALSIQSVQNATNGTVSINADGNVVFTPVSNYSGIASFSYTVSDGQGGLDSATVTLDVVPVADAPSLNTQDAISVRVGETTISTVDGLERSDLEADLDVAQNYLNDRFDPSGPGVNDPGTVQVADGEVTTDSQNLTAGTLISWSYTFTDGENRESEIAQGFNDIVALVVTSPSGTRETLQVDSSENRYPNQTEVSTYSYTATESGHYQFQWLVLNGRDANKDSSLSLSTPSVSIPGITGTYGAPIDLAISAALADQDGSESLAIQIGGIPTDAALTAGVQNDDGTWTLESTDLEGLQLLPPQDFTGDIPLSVTATATESENGDTQTVTETFTVTVDATETTISGSPQGDDLQGNATNDLIRGYTGDDALTGGEGNDYLIGGAGNDTLTGGVGSDVLTGGVGADVFEWTLGDANAAGITEDVVTDFTLDDAGYTGSGDGDQLQLADLLEGAEPDSISDYLMAQEENGDTVLYLNTDGSLANSIDNASQSIVLSGVSMDGQTSEQFVDSLLGNNQIKIE